MGSRVNIHLVANGSHVGWLYAHWSGYRAPHELAHALSLAMREGTRSPGRVCAAVRALVETDATGKRTSDWRHEDCEVSANFPLLTVDVCARTVTASLSEGGCLDIAPVTGSWDFAGYCLALATCEDPEESWETLRTVGRYCSKRSAA